MPRSRTPGSGCLKAEEAALRERELYNALKGWNIPDAVVIGGYAASARSIPRYSHDIDLLLPRSRLPAAQAHLAAAELSLTKEFPEVEQNYGGMFQQWSGGATKVTIELLIGSVQDRRFQVPLPYALLADRAEPLLIRGVSISPLTMPVACPEALIAMKIQPLRHKDLGDICCLAHGPIDEKHLKHVMRPLLTQRQDLLSGKIAALDAALRAPQAANTILGPRVPGPQERRAPIIRSAMRLTATLKGFLSAR